MASYSSSLGLLLPPPSCQAVACYDQYLAQVDLAPPASSFVLPTKLERMTLKTLHDRLLLVQLYVVVKG
jgi:hypothetical protein